ncbi:MAG: pyridoxamine 5'-phosphate oxidase family protein [Candidatus Heimdallarchaeaceae archaeon]
MTDKKITFSFVEQEIRKKTFGILTTLNNDGTPHTSGILYGVSPPETKLELYLVTEKNFRKTKNIERNPAISYIIPFPHHIIRFAPASTVTINGIAQVISIDNKKILEIFQEKRILRLITAHLTEEEKEDLVFVKIKPNPKVLCYGLGINVIKLRGSHTTGGYSVIIPNDRR